MLQIQAYNPINIQSANEIKAKNKNFAAVSFSDKNSIRLEQLSFCGRTNVNHEINELFFKFNKPVMPKEHLEKWVSQFDPKDRRTAMKLASAVDYNSYTDVVGKVINMHQRLTESLKTSGFDSKTFKDVDFSRAYTCKSGDVVSYIYRKANKIRNTCFKSMETLQAQAMEQNKNRALIILDDYTGTGGQFLSEYYARNDKNRELLNSYGKIYFMPITANESAVKKFDLLSEGKSDEVASMILENFKDIPENYTDGALHKALAQVKNDKLVLLNGNTEYPLLSEQNTALSKKDKKEIEAFLLKYHCGNPFGMGSTQGHTTFFYSAPNNMPDILWNSKMQEKGLIPLFSRTNDISIYPMSASIPLKHQVW